MYSEQEILDILSQEDPSGDKFNKLMDTSERDSELSQKIQKVMEEMGYFTASFKKEWVNDNWEHPFSKHSATKKPDRFLRPHSLPIGIAAAIVICVGYIWYQDRQQQNLLAQALNPFTSSATLERLADSQNREIQLAIALHSHTPERIFERLAKTEDVAVRLVVAQNLRVSNAILEELARDPAPEVKRAAQEHLKTRRGRVQLLAISGDLLAQVQRQTLYAEEHMKAKGRNASQLRSILEKLAADEQNRLINEELQTYRREIIEDIEVLKNDFHDLARNLREVVEQLDRELGKRDEN